MIITKYKRYYQKKYNAANCIVLEKEVIMKKLNKKSHKILIAVIIAAILLGVYSTSSKSNYSKEDTTSETRDTETKEEETVYGIGDVVGDDDMSIKFVDVKESKGNSLSSPKNGNVYVLLYFEVTNKSEKELTVSSVLGFSCYADDTLVEQDIFACGDEKLLDATITKGKTTKGIVSYEVPKDYKKLTVEYSPDFIKDKITFVYNK